MDKNTNQRKKKKKRKISWKLLLEFIIFQVIFTCFTAPFILLYGPFENAKSTFVGTAMGSMHYKWLATKLLSDNEIERITGGSDNNKSMDGDDNLIKIPKVQDDSISHATLDGNENFIGHVIFVNDPSRIKIGYSSKLNLDNREGETTSQIAINNNAVAAINGGAFTDEAGSQDWTANGGKPCGVIISNGKVIYDDSNNMEKGTIAMTKDGKLLIGYYTLDELKEKDVMESVSYATTLLVNKGESVEIPGTDSGSGTVPRTLIGQRKDGSIVLVVLNSKKPGGSTGAYMKEAQEVMQKLECITAGVLDGGKSTTMYYEGEVVNDPSYVFGERSIATAIIVK